MASGKHRGGGAGHAPTPRQGDAEARACRKVALPAASDKGDRGRNPRRPCLRARLCRGGRPAVIRRPGAARCDAARRPRPGVRVAAPEKPRPACAVHALGRPRSGQRRRGDRDHTGRWRRCLLRRRARARREGPRPHPRLHPRGPRRNARPARGSTAMTTHEPNSFRAGPDERGRFGLFGGRFVAETLMPLILDLEKAYAAATIDPTFQREMDWYLAHYVGRPSPLYFAERLTEHLREMPPPFPPPLAGEGAVGAGGAKIYFKRDELNHTGAHKVNNVLGQVMLAKRMGKPRVIAETGAGQHGVATATLCARFGLKCVVYMGEVDVERQKPNVLRMKMLGAEVRPVTSGSATLKDAMNEALRDWVTNVADTFYCIGTVAGPHPYPAMVRDFQAIIGREVRAQMLEAEGRLPDSLIACIGGGSNAMGLFHPFLDEPDIAIYGVEAAGHGLASGLHAASISGGRPGILHGNRTYLLKDEDGQINEAHSIS